MRFCFAFAMLAASFASHAFSGDDLYSEVALEKAFISAPQNDADDVDKVVSAKNRVVGKGTLAKLLIDAGYDAKKEDGNTVSTIVRHKQLEFTAYLSLVVHDDRLVIRMPVTTINDKTKLSPSKLLELLAIGQEEEDIFCAYSADQSQIELRHIMNNRGVTPNAITEALSGLALAAETHQEKWDEMGESKVFSTETPTSPSDLIPPTTPLKTTAPEKPKLTLTGTWTASLGKDEAFAIELKTDSTFRLVHLKSGKSTISEGKAKRSGNQLSLAGKDGITITGTVSQTSANEFELAISGADGKLALSLRFKSAR